MIYETKVNRIPYRVQMNEQDIALYINRMKSSNVTPFDISVNGLQKELKDVDNMFFDMQMRFESIAADLITKMPKRNDKRFEKSRVHVMHVFNELYHVDNEFNTTSRLQFYAKAIDNNTAEIMLATRKD